MIGKSNAQTIIQSGGGGADNFTKYHIQQVVNGDECSLVITTYVDQQDDNYWIGNVVSGSTQELYLTEAEPESVVMPYTRPDDWLKIPALNTTNDEIYILNGVEKDGLNMIYFSVNGTGTIDWGDGNTDTFTSQRVYSHQYDYDDISENTWTDHNNTRQALIKISGNRGAITYFSLGEQYSYTNEDGVTTIYGSASSSNVYEVKANVSSCSIYCSSRTYTNHKKLEAFDWTGTTTNSSMAYMFNGCSNLQKVNNLSLDNATDMSSMFNNCYNLKSVQLLNTNRVTNMFSAFSYCSNLEELPLFDTSNVTNMQNAFTSCKNLKTIPKFNTSKVTDMYSMFNNCPCLQAIPLLDTSKATNMSYMFTGCLALQNIPQLDTSSCLSMNYMFNGCSNLRYIPLLNSSKVTNMSYMFSGCTSLQTIPLLDTSKVTNMSYMFNACSDLQKIPQLNTESATNMSSMFNACSNLLKIPQINTGNVTNMSGMFGNCQSLQIISQLDASKVTNATSMITYGYLLKKIKLYNFNPTVSSSITFGTFNNSKMFSQQDLVDFFNSLPSSPAGTRTIQITSTLTNRLANCYVTDSGNYYTAIMPTQDTTIDVNKTYYTYDENTDIYTEVTPDFTSDTFYYELKTAGWHEYEICESTDAGATLVLTWIANKGYTIT